MSELTRICNKCNKTLPLTLEYFGKNTSTNTGGDKYLRPDCKVCNKIMRDGRDEAKKIVENLIVPDYGYNKERKRTENGHPCDNCGKTDYAKKIVFDHDHKTLEFRGWLCDACNRSIGMVGDTVEKVCNVLSYLLKRELSANEIVKLMNDGIENKKIKNIIIENDDT